MICAGLVGVAGNRERDIEASELRECFRSLLDQLKEPRGGTRIGAGLRAAMASPASDVLVITDGKSYDLDVHELAGQGRRVSVILVGGDSLEANVGHLAALTGGQVFVATGADLSAAIVAAIRSMRHLHEPFMPTGSLPDAITVGRAGMRITAEWRDRTSGESAHDAIDEHAVAAFAASLALPVLLQEEAAKLAESEGLVNHLTSLVLIDEAGETQGTIPATRKIPLPRPAAAAHSLSRPDFSDFLRQRADFQAHIPVDEVEKKLAAHFRRLITGSQSNEVHDPIRALKCGERIPWDLEPQRLLKGDLDGLSPYDAFFVENLAAHSQILEAAAKLSLNPIVLVLALLARTQATQNRAAARIARAILGETAPPEAEVAATALELH